MHVKLTKNQVLLYVLSYSGGVQSTVMLHMALRGEMSSLIGDGSRLVVLNADPGMENTETYSHVAMMRELCEERGVFFKTVDGPNLYLDLLALRDNGATRIDNPPYWTRNRDTGKRGRLRQACTQVYKIAPMDREVRRQLSERYGIGITSKRIPPRSVIKLIGFSADEQHRVSEPGQKYVRFAYPLIDAGLTKQDCLDYLRDIGQPIPPRSVCNACFANDAAYFRAMAKERPADFAQAVAVDESVRDLTQVGVQDEVFVSHTLRPVAELAGDETIPDLEEWSCDSGYCFL